MRRPALLLLFLLCASFFVSQSAAGRCVADKDYIQDSAERERMIAKADWEEYKVRRVELAGNLFTRDETVRRKIFLNEGDIFTRDNLNRSLQNLSKFKQFVDPGKIEDVRVILNEEQRYIDFSIHFLDKRAVAEVDDLVGKDIYAAALYATLQKMQEEWGIPQGGDFTQAIVIGKKNLISRIPRSHNNFTAERPSPEELEARYISSGRPVRVFRVTPYVRVGSSIRIRIEVEHYPKPEDDFRQIVTDWSNVYLSIDWKTGRLMVREVCLGQLFKRV
ncbi:MAG: hypothetical protein J5I65_11215 [Aridibacter famidurans]|nr:hypothetical protein [Aridibacter famidurans]